MTQVEPAQPGERADEERLLRVVRPAMFRARPLLFGAHAGVIAAAIVLGVWTGLFTKYAWVAIPCAIVGVVALASLGWWWLDARGSRLRITTVRSVQDRGFFSRHTSEVLHDDIRNIRISQSLWNRIWHVGTIEIGSAGHQGFEIMFKNVRDPYGVRHIIDDHRDLDDDDDSR